MATRIDEFWGRMKAEYPLAMNAFELWFSKYTEKYDWDSLFNAGSDFECSYDAPAFYDLPIALQFGIFLQFASIDDGEFHFSFKNISFQDVFEREVEDYLTIINPKK